MTQTESNTIRAGLFDPCRIEPKASICVMTYNHAAFIRQAMDSVLSQETSFPFEIVIGDDCSTDNTRAILEDYRDQHPDRIRLSHYEKNRGARNNYLATLDACQGEYVALLDGDDYWLSPTKLAKQVALLDANPSFSMCFHGYQRVLNEDTEATNWYPTDNPHWHAPERKTVYDLSDMAVCRPGYSSVVFRRNKLAFPRWFHDECTLGDWPTVVLLTMKGPAGYIDSVMSAYRIHDKSAWQEMRQSKISQFENTIHHLQIFKDHLPAPSSDRFAQELYRQCYRLAHMYAYEKNYAKARSYAYKRRDNLNFDPQLTLLEPLKIHLHLWAPNLYIKIVNWRQLFNRVK